MNIHEMPETVSSGNPFDSRVTNDLRGEDTNLAKDEVALATDVEVEKLDKLLKFIRDFSDDAVILGLLITAILLRNGWFVLLAVVFTPVLVIRSKNEQA